MELAYDRLGEGPTLVLLHPLGADRRVWEPIVGWLAGRYELIAVDLPGFGGSPPLADKPTPAALADAVAGFLEGLGREHAHAVGNSLGGWVALELALSGRALSASAIAPAGLWPEPLMPKRGLARNLARGALPLVDRIASSARGRALLLAGTVARPERVPAQAAAHLVRAYATAPGFQATNDAMRADRFHGLERIQVPVTLIWPEHDRLVRPPAVLPANVESCVLPGAGHIPMWDAPAEVSRILAVATDRAQAPR